MRIASAVGAVKSALAIQDGMAERNKEVPEERRMLIRIGINIGEVAGPVVGIVAGWLVLGEAIDGRIVVGTALIIGGVGLVNSRYGSRRLYGRGGAGPARAG